VSLLIWIPWFLLLVTVALFGWVLYTYIFRGTHIVGTEEIEDGDAAADSASEVFVDLVEATTNLTFSPGNAVDVFHDNERFFDALFDAMRCARSLLTWHVFFFKPGPLADRVADALIERASAGVRVRFLHDAYGSKGTPPEFFERLRRSGVEVNVFRPFTWRSLYKAQQRMHVRSVVIDGRVGFTGGFGIAEEWDGPRGRAWRDTNLRVRGPIVRELQASFVSNWAEACGRLITGNAVFPDLGRHSAGAIEAAVLFSSPAVGTTAAERFLVGLIARARERLLISTGYFVPDRRFRAQLREAVARGVDVQVLTPGRNTDQPPSFHAGAELYEELLRGGVRIHHYRPTMMHAKTFVVDRDLAAVGTLNFDNRSVELNDEVLTVIRDRGITEDLAHAFAEDRELSDPVDLEWVRNRSFGDRMKGKLARRITRLL